MPMLYHIPKSVSSPIVQCLVELGLVGDSLVANELSFADIKESSYLDINPMGTAPTFQDGDVIIWESGAVLTYLLERYDTHHKLHPASLSTTSTPAQIADFTAWQLAQRGILPRLQEMIESGGEYRVLGTIGRLLSWSDCRL